MGKKKALKKTKSSTTKKKDSETKKDVKVINQEMKPRIRHFYDKDYDGIYF